MPRILRSPVKGPDRVNPHLLTVGMQYVCGAKLAQMHMKARLSARIYPPPSPPSCLQMLCLRFRAYQGACKLDVAPP